MKVFLITEGNKEVGFGHITRCISLYQSFEEYNIKPTFIINCDESVKKWMGKIDFLSFDWLNNPQKIFKIIKNSDIVIIDSYMAPKYIYKKISDLTNLTVSIDDNCRINYPKGIVLNGAINATQFNYPLSRNIEYLLGTHYIPLRKEFKEKSVKKIKKNIETIMVTFGGEDSANMTPRIIEILKKYYPTQKKKIVIGTGFKNIENIQKLTDSNIEMEYNVNAQLMKDLMLQSDVAISAGGQTIYELAKIGIPSIIIGVAKNQINQINGWDKNGFICYAGWKKDPDLNQKIIKCLKNLENYQLRQKKSVTGKKEVDGQGSTRTVRKIMNTLIKKELVIKKANINYIDDIYILSNDPEVRKQSFNSKKISYHQHKKWFLNQLKNQNNLILIAESQYGFIGQIRFSIEDQTAIISISIINKYRGFGIGQTILDKSLKILYDSKPEIRYIKAYVKASNPQSKTFFLKSDFKFITKRKIRNHNALEFIYNIEEL